MSQYLGENYDADLEATISSLVTQFNEISQGSRQELELSSLPFIGSYETQELLDLQNDEIAKAHEESKKELELADVEFYGVDSEDEKDPTANESQFGTIDIAIQQPAELPQLAVTMFAEAPKKPVEKAEKSSSCCTIF